MSSYFSSVFGGATDDKPKTKHGLFVATVLMPLVLQLQKEIRGRKYKEVQGVFDAAVESLKVFEAEQSESAAIETATVTTEDLSESHEESSEFVNVNVKNNSTLQEALGDLDRAMVDVDDPQSREPIEPAIETTLEAFIAVLSHPSKVTKPCDLALEGIALLVANRYVSGRAGGMTDTSGSGPKALEIATQQGVRPPPPSLLHRLVESVAKMSESVVESTQACMIKTMRTIMTSPKCAVHESTMLLAIRSIFHVYLISKSSTVKDLAKSALLDMDRLIMGRMEAYEAMSKTKEQQPRVNGGTTEAETYDDKSTAFASQYHADSYALFRSLCKMSSKEITEDKQDDVPLGFSFFNQQADPMDFEGKILSLELILAAVEFSGEAFCEGDRFVYLVQHYLCVSLLKNCMSNNTQVAYLSQKIFLVLLFKFKGDLKQEIEVFMSNVFLRVLESENSSFKQKGLVLESLRGLCGDPVLLTQLFLNYDCDFDSSNLYKDIVHMLTKIGGKATSSMLGSLTASKKEAEQEFELSLAGLEVLVAILKACLKALGLPGGESDQKDDTAGAKIRGMLQIDIGLAVARPPDASTIAALHDSMNGDELAVSVRDIKAEDPAGTFADKIVDAFEQKRTAEEKFETGSVKFTLNLKTGLNYFIENGYFERNAKAVALFFLANKDKLDKTQMGEVLGREPDAAFVKGEKLDADQGGKGFYVRILHHYADALDLTGLEFDEAIRLFLSGFRLPGEAQKIDRIMEKFAQRYVEQNMNVFPSADTAFILAFSVIMLNTDLHNPSIKPEKRMSLDGFIRNNRGIGDNGSDLPEAFLTDIYNRIRDRPFSLKEDDAARERVAPQKSMFEASVFFEGAALFGTTTEDRKRDKFKKERDEIMEVTQQLVRRRTSKKDKSKSTSLFTETIPAAEVVKPIFHDTWGPMLGLLSQTLECADDERSTALCLNAFVYAIRIAAHSDMTLARDTFISSLGKFTYLGSMKDMKKKNVESIKTLLSIAVIDGEHLGDSWACVLQCISQISRLRLSASGLRTDESFLVEPDKPKQQPAKSGRDFFRMPAPAAPTKVEIMQATEDNNGSLVLEAVQEVLIDKVFSSTVNLTAYALIDFLTQLIVVSSAEIDGKSKFGITGVDSNLADHAPAINSRRAGSEGPSVFSLLKLVEVADYNMDTRPRLVWSQVWEKMAAHFAKIACHENVQIAAFSIDALKQLSSKFLEKPELAEFNFQRMFMNPFLVVMENENSKPEIREMVLQVIDNTIRTRSRNLRSGWKVIFSIIKRSAVDRDEKIDFMGLSVLQRLLDEHLTELCSLSDSKSESDETTELSAAEIRERNSNVDDFVGLCRASLSFVHQEESDSARPIGITMRAFSHVAIYADLLAEKQVLPPASGAQSTDPTGSGYTYDGLSSKDALEMVLWRPLYEGLAAGIRSSSKSTAGGVGCLLQRSSVMALRSIMLRHGNQFTTDQLQAILEQSILPAIQVGAELDKSPVIRILSESPAVSSIDFLVEAPHIPPPPNDISILSFRTLHPPLKRSIGPAELMLEASFADLRHGGDGDLRKAFALAKKSGQPSTLEQPFPDSWIVTTAPLALGLLTDVITEICIWRGSKGREKIWPLIVEQFEAWCIHSNEKRYGNIQWRPCEALVRISCREIRRCLIRLSSWVQERDNAEASFWASTVLSMFSRVLSRSLETEEATMKYLIRAKTNAMSRGKVEELDQSDQSNTPAAAGRVNTPFGKGTVLETKTAIFNHMSNGLSPKGKSESPKQRFKIRDYFGNQQAIEELSGGTFVTTSVIELDFGATLYQPVGISADKKRSVDGSIQGSYWEKFVPELKIRCTVAHCLQVTLAETIKMFAPLATEEITAKLLNDLSFSQKTAESALVNQDISTAFQEALLSEWGDGVAAVDEALETAARLSHLHGSGMYFLTQESSATRAAMAILSNLYTSVDDSVGSTGDYWDKEAFAEPLLLKIMSEVLDRFLTSEELDGGLVDPKVWRNVSESGSKVALYCTSFASVVVEILHMIQSFKPGQFEKQKQELFPILCDLVRVQSEEIRMLVRGILMTQVGPLIGVPCDLASA
ncbi:hypothetical protein MPSEU_000613900 [Mayamaea pseudoterrestris]|nr:hypothetical protein MPSEU_000613900 [Mayamaea pseudoterrestris]